MAAMDKLQKLEKESQDDYRPEELINQLDMILNAIREVLPADMKEALFLKIEEYQLGQAVKRPKKLKAEELEEADEGYIDADLQDDF